MHSKTFILTLCAIFFCNLSFAQYTLNGSATQNNCHCYTLTQDGRWQSGSVWNNNKINLNQSFDFNFNVFLGCNDPNGADGMTFVLQPISTSIGVVGGGMGFQGIVPSVGVTLDTYQNNDYWSGYDNDPAYDHIDIQFNGNIVHDSLNPPPPISASSFNVEDCKWHVIRINWDASSKIYSVYFDGVFRKSIAKDLVADIFYGDPMVYWGFTAATGSLSNLQQVCTSLNPQFYFTASQKKCVGKPITFYDSTISFGPVAKRYWDFGDGSPSDSSNINPVHIYNQAGTYTVTLTVQTIDSCSEVVQKQITIGNNPIANILSNNVCEDSTLNFTDASSVTGSLINSWYWDFGNGQTSTQQNPGISYNSSGIKTVKLFTQSAFGCSSDTISKNVEIYPKAISAFNFSGNQCSNSSIQFNDSSSVISGNILSWQWNFGNGQTSTQQNPLSLFLPGSYQISLTTKTDKGCGSDIVKPLNVFAKPIAGFQNVNACENTALRFIDSSYTTDGSTINSWYWDFGNGQISTQQNPSITYSSPGNYTVKLIVSTGTCSSELFTKVITVNNKPVAKFNTANACQDSTVYLSDESTTASSTINSWYWNFGNGQTSIQQNPTTSYSSSGIKTIKLVVQSLSGCVSDTFSKTVEIYPSPIANFSFINNTCQSTPILFNDQSTISSGNISSWNWDFGNGQTSTQPNSIATYNNPGIYLVSLVTISDKGCKSLVKIKSVTTAAKPVAYFKSNNICESVSTSFSDSSYSTAGNIVQWNWNFGNGQTSTQQNPTINYNSTGSYTVKLVVSIAGCSSDTFSKVIVVNAKPVANFTAINACKDSMVNMTDASYVTGSGINNWNWNFSNGQTSTQQNPITTYNSSGTKSIKLVVESLQGCISDTVTKTVEVYPTPIADFSFTNSCVQMNVPFHDLSSVYGENILSWQWNFGNGQTSTLQNPVINFGSSNIYQVSLNVTSDKGCKSVSVIKPVSVQSKPVAAFSNNLICQSGSALFTDSSYATNGQTINTWWWSLGNGSSSLLQNPSTTYSNYGDVLIKLVVTSSAGCVSDTLVKTLNINPKPIANFIYSQPLCADKMITFTDSSFTTQGYITYYNWLFDNGNTSVQKNSLQSFTSGSHTAKLFVKNNAGCISDTITKVFFVDRRPLVSMNFLDACLNFPVSFSSPSAMGDPIISWTWNFGDGSIATGNNTQHTYRQSGNFPVKLFAIAQTGCLSDTVQKIIHVYKANANAGKDIIAAPMQPVQLQATGGTVYTWSPSAGLNNPFISNPIATVPVDQTYFVKILTVQGCEAYDTVSIKIYKGPEMYIPNAFSPNGDGLNDVLKVITVGIIKCNYFKIYNRWGKEVFETNEFNNGWDGISRGTKQPGGVYVWIASGVDFKGNVISKKGIVVLVR